MNGDRNWIPGFEGKYFATWDGCIYHSCKNGKNIELKGYHKGNLHCVKLSNGAGYTEMPFQRAVWMAFKGPIPDGYLVVRKTNILTMNGMNNLLLRSKSQHGKKTGAMSNSKEVELLDNQGEIVDSWPSARKAALDLYVSYQTVMDICNGKVKKPILNVRWAKKGK
ncbi:hypothetical protein [Enterococcus asini]|uniref:hypothetical protein n=1 Tax=Enterococcus asini TaxID=57732 RepID=UPI0026DAB7D9|nr:hypothetical protein [Enterococcus asini]